MSEIEQNVVQQLLVPAYVWQDGTQRSAALTKVGQAMSVANAQLQGETIDVDNATVTPIGLKAQVAHVDMGLPELTSFVGYDRCDVEQADLVMIVVDAKVVSS